MNTNTTINETLVEKTLTPEQWRSIQNRVLATPNCPNCKCHLGIQMGMFRDDGRDAWKCDSGCQKAFHTVTMVVPVD